MMHLNAELRLSVGQMSVAGRKPRNEDSIGIRIPAQPLLTHKGAVAVLADGVSCAEAGQEASETCVQSFLSDYFSTPDAWSVKTSAQKVLTALNRWLYGQGQRFMESRKGYVSTLSALVIKSTQAHLFHVGDSRVWLLRDGHLEQLSQDHATYVGAETRYLTRAMGLDSNLDIDYSVWTLRPRDLLLLTSDGIHDFLGKEAIRALLAAESDVESACRQLVDAALAAGSDDNLSCQLLRVERLPILDENSYNRELTQLPFPPPLSVGDELDGLRVDKVLHGSPRSQVYLVRDVAGEQRYVMKTPSVNFEDDPAYIERFVLEEWIGRRIQSPYVVKVAARPRPKTRLYYLMEYVEAVPLGHWIRDNSQPDVRRVIAIVEQIVKGARAFHRRETLHQDLKPDNILIDNQDRVKLIDFGSCRVAGVAEIAAPIQREQALGTASYSAPEHALGRHSDTRAEMFSIAVIAYEMLTGSLPYGEAFERAKSPAAFLGLRYRPAYQDNPMVPVWLDGALKKALSITPDQRYESLSEWLHDLHQPNPALLPDKALPLLERDPLLFWKGLCVVLGVMQGVTLWWFLG